MDDNQLTVTYTWPQGTKVGDVLLTNEIIEIFGQKGVLNRLNKAAEKQPIQAQFEVARKTHSLPIGTGVAA